MKLVRGFSSKGQFSLGGRSEPVPSSCLLILTCSTASAAHTKQTNVIKKKKKVLVQPRHLWIDFHRCGSSSEKTGSLVNWKPSHCDYRIGG